MLPFLAERQGDSSNFSGDSLADLSSMVFNTLSDWEEQLKHLDIDFNASEDNSGDAVSADLERPQP